MIRYLIRHEEKNFLNRGVKDWDKLPREAVFPSMYSVGLDPEQPDLTSKLALPKMGAEADQMPSRDAFHPVLFN